MSKKLYICRGKSCKKADPKKKLEKLANDIIDKKHIKKTKCLGICKSAFAVEYKGQVHSCPTKSELEDVLNAKK